MTGAAIGLLAAAWAAEVMGTMAGFGAATVLTPVASYLLPMKTAVALVAVFHLFGNAWRLYFFRRQAQWPVVWRFGLPGVLSAFAGAQLAAWMPGHLVRAALGAFLLAYAASEALGWSARRLSRAPGTLLAGGVASGIVAGLIGTGGAIRSACLLVFGLPKEAYLATSAAIALAVDAARLPVYAAQGFFPGSSGRLLAALLAVAFLGAWTGQRLVRRLPPAVFRRFVLTLLAVMGAKLLLDGVRGMA